jgi:hypothetical protein
MDAKGPAVADFERAKAAAAAKERDSILMILQRAKKKCSGSSRSQGEIL